MLTGFAETNVSVLVHVEPALSEAAAAFMIDSVQERAKSVYLAFSVSNRFRKVPLRVTWFNEQEYSQRIGIVIANTFGG